MKRNSIFIIVVLLSINLYSQGKYLTKDGYISFFSHSMVEDIKADNHQVVSIIDSNTGEIAIQLLMKSFVFKKALMQEHFNESYVESYKYPKAIFKGFISNLSEVENGSSEVEIKGLLTLHGEQKEVEIKAEINKQKKSIELSGHFMVKVADFNINIPTVVRNNIAKIIKVSFELNHKPYK